MSPFVWQINFWFKDYYIGIGWASHKGLNACGFRKVFYKLHYSTKDPWL